MTEERPQLLRSLKLVLLDGGAVALCLGLCFFAVGYQIFQSSRRCSRRVDKVKFDIMALANGLDDFAIEHAGKYPDRLDSIIGRNGHPINYLNCASLPLDPWGREYVYSRGASVSGHGPAIHTLGRDGEPGGTGDDEDQSLAKYLGEPWTAPPASRSAPSPSSGP